MSALLDFSNDATEQRHQPRYQAHFSARVSTAITDGRALITDLSMNSLQMRCDRQLLDELLPNQSHHPTPRFPVLVRAQFQLPSQSRLRADVDLQCHIIYVRREAMDKFIVGARVHRFAGESQQALNHYLEHFAKPL